MNEIQNFETLPLQPPDRQAKLRAWLVEHRVSVKDIAMALGVANSMASAILSGSCVPAWHLEKLKELGIPEDLLPETTTPYARKLAAAAAAAGHAE